MYGGPVTKLGPLIYCACEVNIPARLSTLGMARNISSPRNFRLCSGGLPWKLSLAFAFHTCALGGHLDFAVMDQAILRSLRPVDDQVNTTRLIMNRTHPARIVPPLNSALFRRHPMPT